MFYIYIIQNKINNKIYVGKTKSPNSRFNNHKNIASGSLAKAKEFKTIHAALKKYGFDNFNFMVIEEWENENETYEAEKFWIEFLDSKRNGYNETVGGEGVGSGSDNPMFGKRHSEKAKLAMSEKRKREKHPLWGKNHSAETKNKLSKLKIDKYNGEKNPRAKLSNKDAQRIRSLHKTKDISINGLAKMFSVNRNIIERIIRNETYRENNLDG